MNLWMIQLYVCLMMGKTIGKIQMIIPTILYYMFVALWLEKNYGKTQMNNQYLGMETRQDPKICRLPKDITKSLSDSSSRRARSQVTFSTRPWSPVLKRQWQEPRRLVFPSWWKPLKAGTVRIAFWFFVGCLVSFMNMDKKWWCLLSPWLFPL